MGDRKAIFFMFSFQRCKKNETWRYFSYSLVHADGGHLSVNLVLFLVLGTSLHLTNKTVVLLVIYVLGVSRISQSCQLISLVQVVSGSLAYYVFDAGGKQLVGCSGGVYCLVGTFFSSSCIT